MCPVAQIWSRRSRNVRGVQWHLLDATDRRCTSLFMTPDGRVGTRWELQLRYKSETMLGRKAPGSPTAQGVEKLVGRTDFQWVREHPNFVPKRPRGMRRTTYGRLRKQLTTTPEKAAIV